ERPCRRDDRDAWPRRRACGTAQQLSGGARNEEPIDPPDDRASKPAPVSVSPVFAMVAALVPSTLAALADPAQGERAQRTLALGLTLGSDRGGGPPIGQALVPLASLIPFGPIEVRAAIALSIPAAVASYLV